MRAAGLNGADMLQRLGPLPAAARCAGGRARPRAGGRGGRRRPRRAALRRRRPGDGSRRRRRTGRAGRGARAHRHPGARRRLLGEAGGFPEVFTTAHDALFTQCGLAMGERVLVHGAAGGVGTAGVQLAAVAGAQVTATVRNPGHRASSRRARRRPSWHPTVSPAHGPFDVVLELVGAPNLAGRPRGARARRAHRGDRCAAAGAEAELNLAHADGAGGAASTGPPCAPGRSSRRPTRPGRSRRTCCRFLAAGRVTVPVAATFPMAEAEAAYDRFAAGGKLGKVVLLASGTG